MERPVVVSAPGKVILHGEHAVVYGKAALASSLDLRCFLLFLPMQNGAISLELPDFQLQRKWQVSEVADCLHLDEGDQLQVIQQLSGIDPGVESSPTHSLAILAFLYLLIHIYGDRLKQLSGLSVTAVSTLPAGAGLGSSAAYSVCLAAGLQRSLKCSGRISSRNQGKDASPGTSSQSNSSLDSPSSFGSTSSVKRSPTDQIPYLPELIVKKLTDAGYPKPTASSNGDNDDGCWSRQELEVINKWGFEAEKLIHGTPSGIDNSISTYGGAIHFRSGKITPLENMPNVRIFLINTKVPRSTKKMVTGVRERHDKYPEIMGPILNSIEAIALRAQRHLGELGALPVMQQSRAKEEDKIYSILQELFTLNQHLLNAIGVGHPALDRVCEIARRFGLFAKLTGGGGGGCAIALVPPGFSEAKLGAVKAAFSEAEFDCWETTIGSGGVAQHYS